ncbi:hypothetical protein PM082_011257 [Marasmius tenuissimus]|nr:hypothetical protein PM082_011257 [Marasmius tenuissimus]
MIGSQDRGLLRGITAPLAQYETKDANKRADEERQRSGGRLGWKVEGEFGAIKDLAEAEQGIRMSVEWYPVPPPPSDYPVQ